MCEVDELSGKLEKMCFFDIIHMYTIVETFS